MSCKVTIKDRPLLHGGVVCLCSVGQVLAPPGSRGLRCPATQRPPAAVAGALALPGTGTAAATLHITRLTFGIRKNNS